MQDRYNRQPENPSEFAEELQAGLAAQRLDEQGGEEPSPEEQQAMALKLEEEKNQSRVSSIKEAAREAAKQAVKKEVKAAIKKKRTEQIAARGIGRALIATSPYWGSILLAIVAIFAVIIIVVMSINYACTEASGSWGVRLASKITGFIGGTDICSQFGQSSRATSLNTQNSFVSGSYEGDAAARKYLAGFGITVNKNCIDPARQADQTCLEGILMSTLQEVSRLKMMCDQYVQTEQLAGRTVPQTPQPPFLATCEVVVTGGTEPGHAVSANCIHSKGYKIDLRLTANLNYFIENVFRRAGSRGSDPQWINDFSGATYVKEDDHWDISVGC